MALEKEPESNISGDEDPNVAVENHRKTLNGLFVSCLTNSENAEDYETFIKCINHSMVYLSNVFVQPHSNTEEKEVSESRKSVSKEFTMWTIGRLLERLSRPLSPALKTKCIEVTVNLFNLVCLRDASSPSPLLKELLSLAEELGQVCDMLYSKNPDYSKAKLTYFVPSRKPEDAAVDGLNWEYIPIVFASPKTCESFQVTMTHIIKDLIFVFAVVSRPLILKMLEVFCYQLETGNVELKKVSLDAITASYKYSLLPSHIGIKDRLLRCLSAMMEYCCSGTCKKLGGSSELEDSLAACWNAALSNLRQDCFRQRQLSTFSGESCVTRTLQIMKKFGLVQLRSQFLLETVGAIINYAFRRGSYPALTHPSVLASYARDTLINHLLNSGYSQWAVKCFFTLVAWEVSVSRSLRKNIEAINNSSAEGVSSNKTGGSESREESPSDSSDEVKRKAKKFPDILSPFGYTETWKTMYCNFKRLIHSKGKIVLASEGLPRVRVLVELGILCTCWIRLPKMQGESGARLFQWFPNDVPNQLCVSIFRYVENVMTERKSFNKAVYVSLLGMIGSMVFAQGLVRLPDKVWPLIISVASLPWIDSFESSSQCESLTKLAVAKKEFLIEFDDEVRMLCLKILATCESGLMSDWRLSVFDKVFICGSEELQIAALDCYPALLQQESSKREVLFAALNSLQKAKDSAAIQEGIAKILGTVCCVLGGQTRFRHTAFLNIKESLVDLLVIECNNCNYRKASVETLLDSNLILPFFTLIEHQNDSVRSVFVRSLPAILRHLKNDPKVMEKIVNLVDDENYNVREAFSKVIPKYLTSKGDSWKEIETIVTSKLRTSYKKAIDEINIPWQETILKTVGQIGRIAEGGLLVCVTICLVGSLSCLKPLITATANQELKEIGKYKNIEMSTLFLRVQEPLCKFISESLLMVQASGSVDPIVLLQEISSVFGYRDVKHFISVSLKHILPHLVSNGSSEASAILKIFAKQQGKNRCALIADYFKFIFVHIVCVCNKSEMEKAMSFVQAESELDIGSLLRQDYQRVHNELLLRISTNYREVFEGLAMLASKEPNWKGSKITTKEQMAEFLQPHLLGFLVFFGAHFSAIPTLEEKSVALKSLTELINLMGQKHITPVRMKVAATLRIALQQDDLKFHEICCTAWDAFVHNVELTALAPMLSQVVVTLLPLLQSIPDQVARVFEFLICENRENAQQYFNEIHLIPDILELEAVNAVLQKHSEDISSAEDFRNFLSHSLKAITHDNLDVRLHSLSKLKYILNKNQEMLEGFISGSDSIDTLISELVTTLLTGSREPNTNVRILIGECLGELGAVDPGRLKMNYENTKDVMAKLHCDVNGESFAYDLLMELVRSFIGAEDSRIQDCSSFAIQELLSIYQCKGKDDSSPFGQKLWNRFSENIQEILNPFLRSKYKLNEHCPVKWDDMPKPLYGSTKGRSFKDWICLWTGYLITKVKNTKASEVFRPCGSIIKYDTNVAIYCIPFIILYIVLESNEESDEFKKQIIEEIMAVLSTLSIDRKKTMSSDLCHMSTQTVFSLLDYLNMWTKKSAPPLRTNTRSAAAAASSASSRVTAAINSVQTFLNQIPHDKLAFAAFNCQAYTRALLHIEEAIKCKQVSLHDQLEFLQKVYAALDEPDGCIGVDRIRTALPTLSEQILAYESAGNLQEALSCYEVATHSEPKELSHIQGVLKCLMGLDQPCTALNYASGVLTRHNDWTPELNQYRVEAAWKLGNWEDLGSFLKTKSSTTCSPGVGIGRILLAAVKKDQQELCKLFETARKTEMGPLSAASMENGAYQRGYEHVIRLHALNELQNGIKVFWKFPPSTPPEQLFQENLDPLNLLKTWDFRTHLVQSSLRCMEPILSVRRALLVQAKEHHKQIESELSRHIGNSWLKSAKIARKSGHQQQAFNYLFEAAKFRLPGVFLEQAKWHWSKREHDQAILKLKKELECHSHVGPDESNFSRLTKEQQLAYAKAKLLLVRYQAESAVLNSASIIKMYNNVLALQPNWEDSNYYFAVYYDRMLSNCKEKDSRYVYMGNIIKFYGNALVYGCGNVYHAMPRMLSLWLDLGTEVVHDGKQHRQQQASESRRHLSPVEQLARAELLGINKMIEEFSSKIPLYMFFTAFSQILSRICHSHRDVSVLIKELITNMLITYPFQSMWLVVAVSKSSYNVRSKRCLDIYNMAKQRNPAIYKYISDVNKFVEKLLDLCNRKVDQGTGFELSVNTHFRNIPRLLESSGFSKIMLPLQEFMTVTLPTSSGSHVDHQPFPGRVVFIERFEDRVEVMPSLQRPKKVTIRGSDGKLYGMMCKPKDDLRKDCRLMEFNTLVNKFLLKDTEARRRQLYIRTYTVVPLNEECGLIEWVPNLTGLRLIINLLLKRKGLYTTNQELRQFFINHKSPLEEKLKHYKEVVLPRFPAVFAQWFLDMFTDSTAWYMARVAYCRTTAVMSMVGYILGLGDRHGENILFDSISGDTVHVDFNCLFNKGETFECPEKVPFRLTHNMIDAMGPTGYEGVYRKSCETTLRVMTNQKETLMSVLRPFIHDPLVEWSKTKKKNPAVAESGEINNEKAMEHVRDIDMRLQGILKTKKYEGLPLAIDGQVECLIQEAISDENLCQMYLGWAAYM